MDCCAAKKKSESAKVEVDGTTPADFGMSLLEVVVKVENR